LLSPDIGGWASKAHKICNFPGHTEVLGKDIKKMFTEHVKASAIDYEKGRATKIEKTKEGFKITTNIDEFSAKYVIYALGTKKRKLGIPGEDEYLGKGVCLCATCDAPFFKNKRVAVIGGNDSGTTSALLIAEYAEKVFVIEVLDKLPTEPVWFDKINKNEKIEVMTGTTVSEIKGSTTVNSIILKTGKEISVDGVFIEIGSIPDSTLAEELGVDIDKWGHLEVGSDQQTNTQGFYGAGDITNSSNYLRQIVSAQAEGAIAANAIYKKIMKE